VSEAIEALRLASGEPEASEVRHYAIHEITERPSFVLEGSISPRLADPAASEERLQPVKELPILLI
jgi:hypothetical protein